MLKNSPPPYCTSLYDCARDNPISCVCRRGRPGTARRKRVACPCFSHPEREIYLSPIHPSLACPFCLFVYRGLDVIMHMPHRPLFSYFAWTSRNRRDSLRRLHRPCPPIQQQLEVGGKSPRHRRHRRIGVVIPCFTSPPFRSRRSSSSSHAFPRLRPARANPLRRQHRLRATIALLHRGRHHIPGHAPRLPRDAALRLPRRLHVASVPGRAEELVAVLHQR